MREVSAAFVQLAVLDRDGVKEAQRKLIATLENTYNTMNSSYESLEDGRVSGASDLLQRFVRRFDSPVTTTFNALGAVPFGLAHNLGMPGMHGTYTATTAMQRSDLLVTFGARFDDRITGDPKHFAPEAKVIHVDIDPAEISKNRFADVPIVGEVVVGDRSMVRESIPHRVRVGRPRVRRPGLGPGFRSGERWRRDRRRRGRRG